MEYYAKSKETELSEREKNNLREKLENLADDLEGDLDEKEQQVVLRELENLKEIIDEISKIKESDIPPRFLKMKLCKKCAYHDLCFI